jgi:hypothetical protein
MHQTASANIQPIKSSRALLFLLGVSVIAFGILSVWQLPQFVDVLGWDEGVYMQNGLLFSKKLQKNWGPMYAAWYYFLHFFQSFPLYLYYLNFQVLTVLPGFLLFVYWTRIGIRPLVAAIVAMFFMASYVNFYSWPKISLFTTSILIGAFIMGTFAANHLQKLVWICGGVLIASYMRPELYLAFAVLLMATLFYAVVLLIKKSAQGWFTWLMLVGLLVVMAGLQIKLGNPLFSMEGARAIAAFAQHYAYNYALWNDLRPDRWQLHGEQIFVADFGRNFDFFSAYKANPEAFMRHVCSNTLRYFSNLWKFYTDLLLPESIFKLKEGARTIVLLLALLPLLILRKFSFRLWWNTMCEKWLEFLLLMVVIGPTFLSVILIFPREHYMVMQTLLLLTLILTISYGFTGWPSPVRDRSKLGWVSAIMMGLLILAPPVENRAAFDNFREPKGTFNKQAVLILQQSELLKDTIVISEDEGGITFFLTEEEKQHFKWTPAMWKQTGFNHYADSMGTQLYYVTPLMLYDDRYRYDEEWQSFLKDFAQRGYAKKEIAKEWYFLYDTTAIRMK